jgi:hypothetical protein
VALNAILWKRPKNYVAGSGHGNGQNQDNMSFLMDIHPFPRQSPESLSFQEVTTTRNISGFMSSGGHRVVSKFISMLRKSQIVV